MGFLRNRADVQVLRSSSQRRAEDNAMLSRSRSVAGFLRISIARTLIAAFAIIILGGSRLVAAQDAKKAVAAGDTALVARGQYIVEGVAVCGNCHTPRKPNGELDRSRWLAGASVPYLPAQPTSDWPTVAPRLAGLPPTSNAGMVTLLTTGIWVTGQPLRDPMPHFHMTPTDAQAVVAYLKSLTSGR
jgi:mono/diheme cytochrome c family protein